jgi:hypothetical protein
MLFNILPQNQFSFNFLKIIFHKMLLEDSQKNCDKFFCNKTILWVQTILWAFKKLISFPGFEFSIKIIWKFEKQEKVARKGKLIFPSYEKFNESSSSSLLATLQSINILSCCWIKIFHYLFSRQLFGKCENLFTSAHTQNKSQYFIDWLVVHWFLRT